MASKTILELINRVKAEVDKNGWDMKYADAYYQYGLYLKQKENDIDMALKCFRWARKGFEDIGIKQTNGSIWQIEKYCFDNHIRVDIVDCYYKCLLEEAFYDFESYIIYLEKNRHPFKRFYQPRKKTLKTVVKDLQNLEDGKYKFYGLSMPSRTGKALAWDTPVLTNHGWKNHGELTLMDKVVGLDGEFKDILAIHNPCYMEYKVTFTDGEEIICHGNHEWVMDSRPFDKRVTIETKEMFKDYQYKDGRLKYQVPTKEPMEGSHNSLWVAPYTMGAWLGDGRNQNPDICGDKNDYAIVQAILDDGYEMSWDTTHKETGVRYYGFKGLREGLQHYGMCHSRRRMPKYIPEDYLTSDIEQRLELLSGLLDTDGTLVKKEHRYHFTTNEETLRDSFVTLVNSFGWRTSITEYEPSTSSLGISSRKPYWVISFNPTMHIPCRLERKQLHEFSKQKRVSVAKIERIADGVKRGNCITVDGGIYCVGKTMKPTHNSTICILFLSWIGLKRPNSHNAMGGHSGILAKGFHKELLNVMDTDEYTFKEMFNHYHPNHVCLRDKSAEEFTITLDEPDRFATFTCRGIDGTWTGAVDISGGNNIGYLYVDDLVRDREHSLSPTRMENTFQEYLNKMVDRKNDGARELMVGTLWNVLDPLERLRVQYEGQEGYFFRRISALDENDESNFAYSLNGFSTEYYREMRERLDRAEWMAKYQQQPFVREGLLMPLEELNYFNGILPEGDHRVLAPCDVAFGGGDSLSMPIGYEFENGDVYIVDWIFNKGAKEVTIPLVVGKIIDNEIRKVRFEGNQGGDLYADYIDKELHNRGYKCSVESKKAPNRMSKVEKIIAYSGDIKRKYYFIQQRKPSPEDLQRDKELGIKRYTRSKEYQSAMDEVGTFVTIGKNTHEDAIDSLTQMEMMIEENGRGRIARITSGLL